MRKKYPFKSNTPAVEQESGAWRKLGVSGLQRTLLVFVVLPLVLLTALGIRFGLEQANQFQEQRLKNDLELVGRAISIPVGTALNNGDMDAVELALESVFVLGEVYGASVFDVDGNRVASAGVTETDLTRSIIPQRIRTTGEGQEAFSRVAGRNVFSHFQPLFDTAGHIQGLVQITRRASDFGRALDQLTIIAWLLWGVFSLVILASVLLGHYGGVGRYVDKLLAHMSRVADGDLSHRAALNGPQEVASLARGLNQMLDSIEQAHRDLDAHRAAETQLVAKLKDNEKMVAIGSMAQGIAHELGAPLSVIDGRARRLERAGSLNEQQQRNLSGIRTQVHRLTRTVRQLLDYCRPAATQPRMLTANLLIQDVLEAIAPELEAKGCQLTTQLPPGLPVFWADAGRLELALLNLLRNALQAAEGGMGVWVAANSRWLVIRIIDDGLGLPENCSPARLTEPFFTTKPPGEGAGLGLAIVQAVAEEQGGYFTLSNHADGGCEACLVLSLAPPKKEA
ncbi:MAG: HAMP domain-containing sensor histidine kinase [Oceanisphaera sp.]|uniref:sensor histidine kinase n=1 Tax=Oceanisphaera sp. TaxID=1929979 RepID=UPI003C73A990